MVLWFLKMAIFDSEKHARFSNQPIFKNVCAGTKTNFTECKSSFVLAQYVNKFLVRHKKFELAQNILGPVKGQGNSLSFYMELVLAVVSSISWIKIY